MKNVKPDYYDEFQCVADRCTMTCCQEWKIAVDEAAYTKWKHVQPPEGMKTRRKDLRAFTTYKDQICVIGLDADHRCPFLNEQKLCRLVTTYGDEMLSETCHIFPREIHEYGTRTEYSLMSCCPEAIDLLQRAGTFTLHEEKTETEENKMEEAYFRIRDFFSEQMQKERTPQRNLLIVYFIALDMYHVIDKKSSAGALMRTMKNDTDAHNMNELEQAMQEFHVDAAETFTERNELFLDLSVNYQKEGLYEKYLQELLVYALSLSEERECISYDEEHKIFQDVYKEYEPLMRKFLAAEIYAGCYLPGGDLESMIVQLQWIAMTYSVIEHCLFLYWKLHGRITYEIVRDYLVVLSRMTGYGEEDIYEYLDNSFENRIWDWGYYALVVGTENI